MIPFIEFSEIARSRGVPVSTIERDYAQNWVLKYLDDGCMTLKGGTGIRKVYVENYRFSDDLDFTLNEQMSVHKIEDNINKAIIAARENSGINFQKEFEIQRCESGYTSKIYFNIARRGGLPMRIKLDITIPENEAILLPVVKRKIFHSFSDQFSSYISAYDLDEILAEKIRTLFERTRPRDLYDIWFFLVDKNRNINADLVFAKCKSKQVMLNIQDFEERKELYIKTWIQSLRHQINELPDPGSAFDLVLEKIKIILNNRK